MLFSSEEVPRDTAFRRFLLLVGLRVVVTLVLLSVGVALVAVVFCFECFTASNELIFTVSVTVLIANIDLIIFAVGC